MNYTTNYHLPQWVEEDRIMMGDFNEAMEKIDEALRYGRTPENTACQYGAFSFTGTTTAGTALATFTFKPRFIVLIFYNVTYIISNGNTQGIIFGSSNYSITIKLQDNFLVLYQNDEDIKSGYSGKFIAWP